MSESSSSFLSGAAKSTLITGDFVGTVIEDQTLRATGDLDASRSSISNKGKVTERAVEFQEIEGKKGQYGTFAIEEDGSWSYKLKNTLDGVQSLAEGEVVTEVFKVVTETGAISYVTINVVGTNDIPVLTGSTTGALTEDDATSIASGKITVADVDHGQSFVQALNQAGQYGAFSIDTNGNWTYTLDNGSASTQALAAGEIVTETFIVTSFDGTVTQNVTVTITGTNDAPVITSSTQTGAVEEDGVLTVSGQVVATGTVLTFSGNADGAYGGFVVDAATGVWTYSLNNDSVQSLAAGEARTETFTVTVTNQFGAAISQDVTVTITGTNDAPVVSDISSTVVEGSSGRVLTAVFSDPDGSDSHTFSIDTTGTIGNITNNNDGTFSYDANGKFESLAAGETATDTFTYIVNDGQGGVVTKTATVTISGSNDAPVITSEVQVGTVEENITPSANGQVTASDVDNGAATAFSGSATGLYGDFVVNANTGEWTYVLISSADQLNAGQLVTENFTVSVSDGLGGQATQMVSINITGTNDAPQITSQVHSGEVADGGTLSAEGQVTSRDADSNATASYSGSKVGTYGSFVVDSATGTWTFVLDQSDPDVQALYQGQNVMESFTVTVTDDQNATSTQDVTISILGKNNPPTITSTAPRADVWEDVTPTSANGTIVAKDVDINSVLTFSVDKLAGAYGDFTLDVSTGTWSYALDHTKSDALSSGETHDELFVVTVTDEWGISAYQTVTVTVHGTNDAPVITDTSVTAGAVTEEQTLSVSGHIDSSDVDIGATATFTGSFTGTYGDFVVDAATGAWTYTLNNGASDVQALAQGVSVTETFSVTVMDDKGTTATQNVVVTVNGTNDAPTVSGLVVTETSISFDATDVDASTTLHVGGFAGGYLSVNNGSTTSLSVPTAQVAAWHAVLGVTDGIAPQVKLIDVYNGTAGNDVVNALSSGSALYGYGGNDTLTGGVGVDYLFGGDGSDTFNVINNYFTAGDVINGGAGGDSIRLGMATTVNFTLGSVTGIENLVGSAGNDTVTISGNEGFVVISLGAGIDTLYVTATGSNTLGMAQISVEQIALAGNGGTLNLSTQLSGFTLYDSIGNDVITGGAAADLIYANQGGTNTLTGGGGADTYTLGAGIDTIIVNSAQSLGTTTGAGTLAGYDIIKGFDVASDILDLQGTAIAAANIASYNGNDSSLLASGALVRSHSITNGIISFDSTDTYAAPSLTLSSTSDVAAVVQYMHYNNIGGAGSTVAFNATIGGTAHTYVFEQVDATPNRAVDTLIDLVGVTTNDLTNLISAGNII